MLTRGAVALACAALAGIATLAASCSAGDPSVPTNPAGVAPPRSDGVTFKDLDPILEKRCRRCHVLKGIAPFPLTTFSDVLPFAASIVTETTARRMPPWGAMDTSECAPVSPWKHDPRLTEQEIALFAKWHADGDLEGPRIPAPVPVATTGGSGGGGNPVEPPHELAGATVLIPTTPYTVKSYFDDVQCFLVDPKIETTKYLNGTFFVPTNITAVHHAHAFAIPKDAKVDPKIAGSGPATPIDAMPLPYECFGGPRIDGARVIAGWAPNDLPAELPPDSGIALEPGTRFVLKVHYHPHHGPRDPDATAFHYRVTDTKPTFLAVPQLIGDVGKPRGGDLPAQLLPSEDDPPQGPELRIPIGKKAHVETVTFAIPTGYPEVRVATVGGHMHLAAKDQKITVSNGTCLMHQPRWSFDWQRSYSYDAPIDQLPRLVPGDSVNIRCTYDNTGENFRLHGELFNAGYRQPKEITFGESSIDEVCRASFVFLVKAN